MPQNITLATAPLRASDPAKDAVAFTGTADVTLTTPGRAVYIGTSGDLKVDMYGNGGSAGATVTFSGVPVGTILPICITKIYDVGTTAAGVVLL